jgi:hypothetical protein
MGSSVGKQDDDTIYLAPAFDENLEGLPTKRRHTSLVYQGTVAVQPLGGVVCSTAQCTSPLPLSSEDNATLSIDPSKSFILIRTLMYK